MVFESAVDSATLLAHFKELVEFSHRGTTDSLNLANVLLCWHLCEYHDDDDWLVNYFTCTCCLCFSRSHNAAGCGECSCVCGRC